MKSKLLKAYRMCSLYKSPTIPTGMMARRILSRYFLFALVKKVSFAMSFPKRITTARTLAKCR